MRSYCPKISGGGVTFGIREKSISITIVPIVKGCGTETLICLADKSLATQSASAVLLPV
jgi:hypothetical protein